MITHELKCWPEQWQALLNGSKNFEVRRNDRHFKVGDVCLFRRWSPEFGYYDQKETIGLIVSSILHSEDFPLGIVPGYVVLGFGVVQEEDDG